MEMPYLKDSTKEIGPGALKRISMTAKMSEDGVL